MEANFIRQLSRHLTTTTFLSEPHKHVNICEEATFRMDITHATAIKGTCIIHIAKQLPEKHRRIHRLFCMYYTSHNQHLDIYEGVQGHHTHIGKTGVLHIIVLASGLHCNLVCSRFYNSLVCGIKHLNLTLVFWAYSITCTPHWFYLSQLQLFC